MIYQTGNMGLSCHHDIRFYHSCNFIKHMHSDFELIIMLSGEAEISADDNTYILSPHDMALIHSNQAHSVRTLANSTMLIHVFSPDITGSFFKMSAGKIGEKAVFRCADAVRDFYIDTVLTRRDFSEYTSKDACIFSLTLTYVRFRWLNENSPRQTF